MNLKEIAGLRKGEKVVAPNDKVCGGYNPLPVVRVSLTPGKEMVIVNYNGMEKPIAPGEVYRPE